MPIKLFDRIFGNTLSLKEQNDTINKLYRKEKTMPSIKRLGGKLEIILPDSFSEKESEEFADKLCQKASEQILGDDLDRNSPKRKKLTKKFSGKSHRQNKQTIYRSRTAEKLMKKLFKNNKQKKN